MKKACKECPFRKTSAPGWLGDIDTTPMKFRTEALSEEGYTCHMTMGKKESQCLGALAHADMSCKSFVNPKLQKLKKEIDKTDIMNVPEFVKHHTR